MSYTLKRGQTRHRRPTTAPARQRMKEMTTLSAAVRLDSPQNDAGLDPTVMYILIGVMSFVLLVIIMGIIGGVVYRRRHRVLIRKSKPKPNSATLHSVKNVAYHADINIEPRYHIHANINGKTEVGHQVQSRVRNENEAGYDNIVDEVYDEIPDIELRGSSTESNGNVSSTNRISMSGVDWKRSTTPDSESRNNELASSEDGSGSIQAEQLHVDEPVLEHTYLELVP